MKNKKQSLLEMIAFILFSLVFVSSILVTNIYAKYASNKSNHTQAEVASFDIKIDVVDSTTLTQILDYEMYPGCKIKLNVLLDANNSDVKTKYIVKITTFNNLPLEFTYNSTDIKTTGISGEIKPHNSIVLNEIIIEWPESIENNNYKYSGEVDLLTVSIEIEQVD